MAANTRNWERYVSRIVGTSPPGAMPSPSSTTARALASAVAAS